MNTRQKNKNKKKNGTSKKAHNLQAATDEDIFAELMRRVPEHNRHCMFIGTDWYANTGCYKIDSPSTTFKISVPCEEVDGND